MIEGLVGFVIAVVVFAIVGVGIGRLMAPRIDRWTAPKDEDAGDGTD